MDVRVRFEKLRFSARKYTHCSGCDQRLARSKTFTATLNPWNRNPDGTVRTYVEAMDALRARAKLWQSEAEMCETCRSGA